MLGRNRRPIIHGLWTNILKQPRHRHLEATRPLTKTVGHTACVGVPLKIIKDLKEDDRMMKDFEEYLDIMRSLGANLVKDADFTAFESGWTQKNRICPHATTSHNTEKYLGLLIYEVKKNNVVNRLSYD